MMDSKRLTVGLLAPIHHAEPARSHDAESTFVARQAFESACGTVFGSTDVEPALLRGSLEAEDPDGMVLSAAVLGDVRFSDSDYLPLALLDIGG